MNLNKRALGNRISKARSNAGLTQEEMADMCSVSVTHIRHLEGGTRAASLTLFVALCNATHTSANYLLQDSVGKTEYDEVKLLQEQVKDLSMKQLIMVNEVAAAIIKYSDND